MVVVVLVLVLVIIGSSSGGGGSELGDSQKARSRHSASKTAKQATNSAHALFSLLSIVFFSTVKVSFVSLRTKICFERILKIGDAMPSDAK